MRSPKSSKMGTLRMTQSSVPKECSPTAYKSTFSEARRSLLTLYGPGRKAETKAAMVDSENEAPHEIPMARVSTVAENVSRRTVLHLARHVMDVVAETTSVVCVGNHSDHKKNSQAAPEAEVVTEVMAEETRATEAAEETAASMRCT